MHAQEQFIIVQKILLLTDWYIWEQTEYTISEAIGDFDVCLTRSRLGGLQRQRISK